MKNRKMKKMMIALCIVIFTMAACSKDKGIDVHSKSDELLLSEISIGDVVIQRLEYNDKNLVTKQFVYDQSKIIFTRIYNYNNDNLPTQVVNDFVNSDDIIETYEYNNDGKPISGTITAEGQLLWNMTFKHEKNKLIHTNISQESNVNINTYTFDDRGNLLKMDFSQNSVPAGVNEWYEYDNKKGVAGSIGDAVFMLFSSPNNPTKARHSFLNQVSEYDLVYTYNDEGYPTIMNRYNKGTKDLVDVTKYKYIPAHK